MACLLPRAGHVQSCEFGISLTNQRLGCHLRCSMDAVWLGHADPLCALQRSNTAAHPVQVCKAGVQKCAHSTQAPARRVSQVAHARHPVLFQFSVLV